MTDTKDTFIIQLNYIVISFDTKQDIKHILSLDREQLVFPKTLLERNILTNVNEHIIKSLQKYIVVNPIYLIPQLISLQKIDNNDNMVDIIYGFFVEHTQNIDSCYWIPMDEIYNSNYYDIVYETIQKLQ